MILGWPYGFDLENPAVLGFERAVAGDGLRVGRERAEANFPAHAMGGADLPKTNSGTTDAGGACHRARRLGGRRSCGGRSSTWRRLGCFFPGLALLARNRLLRIVAILPLHDDRGVDKAHHAVGRLRAFG